MKKNYLKEVIEKNEKLQNILSSYFKLSKKNYGAQNLIALLYHELSFYYSTKIFNKILTKYRGSKYLINPVFGKRNKILIIKESTSISRKITNFISKIFFFKKNIYLGSYIPINNFEKLKFFFSYTFKRYSIHLNNHYFFDKRIYLNQIKTIQDLIYKIHNYFNLKDKKKAFNEIDFFLKCIMKSSKTKSTEYDAIVTGTPAKFINRLNLFEGLKKNMNIVFMHSGESGFIKSFPYQFDERLFGNKIIGHGPMGLYNKNRMKTLKPLIAKSNYFPAKNYNLNKFNFSEKILTFNPSEDLNKKKGLYISSRIKITSITNPYDGIIVPEDYVDWQKFLFKKINRLTYKLHPKQLINFKFKNVNFEKGSLDKIYQNYDYIIFDYLNSLAFNQIVQTQLPIIYFNIGLARFSRIGQKYLKKRCFITNVDIFKNYSGFNKVFTKKFHKKNNKFSTLFCGSNEDINQTDILLKLA